MKIGKYPVKHSYKKPRIIADVISVGLAVFICSVEIMFMPVYDDTLKTYIGGEALVKLMQADSSLGWKRWLTLIFAAKPLDDVSAAPEHPDSEMQCSEWVALEQADELNLYPRPLRRHIKEALCANGALWLGTDFIENDG